MIADLRNLAFLDSTGPLPYLTAFVTSSETSNVASSVRSDPSSGLRPRTIVRARAGASASRSSARVTWSIGDLVYPARRMTRPADFRILTDRSGTRVEIAIHGELDLATAPQLTTAFERASELDGIELAVVDLRSLEFLDSTGLEAIMKFEARSRRQGVDLAVVRGPRAVERLFSVMQLDQKLRIVDDPADA